jgi:hypothetical protein
MSQSFSSLAAGEPAGETLGDLACREHDLLVVQVDVVSRLQIQAVAGL